LVLAASQKPQIYVCPDGVYHQINLNSLLNQETGNYLIDEQDLYLLTNSKELIEKRVKNNQSNIFSEKIVNCLLLGCPQYDLPAVAVELNKIDTILQRNDKKSLVLLDDKANKNVLKNLQGVSLLHLATHGFFGKLPNTGTNTSDALSQEQITHPLLRCGLLLGKEIKDSKPLSQPTNPTSATSADLLTAYETVNLSLSDTKLVVLSACETGLGEVHDGDGIYGLQRAFAVAGADTLLMSLWKVNDRATQLLMVSFYENLIEKQLSPHLALKKAQQTLREKYQHPYFWAAFVMVGK
jgi:CHAT domain-containing protein